MIWPRAAYGTYIHFIKGAIGHGHVERLELAIWLITANLEKRVYYMIYQFVTKGSLDDDSSLTQ